MELKPSSNNYSLPTASSSVLGGIKVGTNLSIDGSGVLSSTNTTYSVGDGGLTQNNFTDSLKSKLDGIATSANNYSLPTSSSSVLGGVKVGTNLSIDGSGVLSSTDTTYSVGDGGLTQNNFTDTLKAKLDGIEASSNNYSLPTASISVLGGVKVGSGLSITNGVLSSTGSGGTSIWSESNSTAGYTGNVSITGNTIVSNDLVVNNSLTINGTTNLNGATTISGHILPSSNAAYDLGNAEYKIRHLFLSDNSLWVGDEHKIDISSGDMKFKKRKKTLPNGVKKLDSNKTSTEHEQLALNVIKDKTNITDFTLNDWLTYAKTLNSSADIIDMFDNDDWEQETELSLIQTLKNKVNELDNIIEKLKTATSFEDFKSKI